MLKTEGTLENKKILSARRKEVCDDLKSKVYHRKGIFVKS
jgi:hypothetical protein